MSYRKNGWQLTGSIGPRFWLSGLWPQFGHCSRSSISQRSSEYSGYSRRAVWVISTPVMVRQGTLVPPPGKARAESGGS